MDSSPVLPSGGVPLEASSCCRSPPCRGRGVECWGYSNSDCPPSTVPRPANPGGNIPAISADQEALLRRIETMMGSMETRILSTNETRLVYHRDALEEQIPGMMRAFVRQELMNQAERPEPWFSAPTPFDTGPPPSVWHPAISRRHSG
jgi:hypothetical protein